jgi:transcription antitermination factor NusG
MFVRINDKDSRSIFCVLNTKGVVRILGSNGSFQPVPAQQIDSVKRLLETNVEYDPYRYLVKGKEVTLVNGPLNGVTGRIVDRKGQKKLIVSIDIIKRSISVTVDPADVELV